MPSVQRIVVFEETYSFTPDTFKASMRAKCTGASKLTSINHLKTGRELLSSEKFARSACVTSPEGKSLINNYVAQNVSKT